LSGKWASASPRDAQPIAGAGGVDGRPSKAHRQRQQISSSPCRSSVSPCEQSEQRVSPLRGKVLRANEQSEQSPRLTFARFARNRFGEALPPFARLLALLVCSLCSQTFFPLGRADGGFARLLARGLAKAMPTFDRLLAG